MKSFESVVQKLLFKGMSFEKIVFTDTAISARISDTSVDKNYDPNKAIKTLIISVKDYFKAVILRGSDRVDQVKLKALVGKWSVVDAETLAEKFKYLPGTICPLDLDLPILIDEKAMELDVWNMGAGALDKGISVNVQEALKYLEKYEIVSIANST
jgi:prolyl-tRNA editing enzyme YbaK/EbsC (Cys-tRNA(Pro) deacylase)